MTQPTNSPEEQAKLFAELEKLECEYKMTMETPHFEHDTYKRGFDMYELADYILGNYIPKQVVVEAIGIRYHKLSPCPACGSGYMYQCTCSTAADHIASKLNLHDNQQRNEV